MSTGAEAVTLADLALSLLDHAQVLRSGPVDAITARGMADQLTGLAGMIGHALPEGLDVDAPAPDLTPPPSDPLGHLDGVPRGPRSWVRRYTDHGGTEWLATVTRLAPSEPNIVTMRAYANPGRPTP